MGIATQSNIDYTYLRSCYDVVAELLLLHALQLQCGVTLAGLHLRAMGSVWRQALCRTLAATPSWGSFRIRRYVLGIGRAGEAFVPVCAGVVSQGQPTDAYLPAGYIQLALA